MKAAKQLAVHSCRPCTNFQDVENGRNFLPSIGSREQAGHTVQVDDIPCSPKVEFFQRLAGTRIGGRIGDCCIVDPRIGMVVDMLGQLLLVV